MSEPQTKLTHAMRRMLVQQVKQEFDEEHRTLQAARTVAAKHLERAAWGDNAVAFYKIKPYLSFEDDELSVVEERCTTHVRAHDEAIILPAGDVPMRRVEAELEAYRRADDAYTAFEERRDTITRTLHAALNQCRTVKQVFDRMPALQKYEASLPEYSAPANIAVVYTNTNDMILKAQQR